MSPVPPAAPRLAGPEDPVVTAPDPARGRVSVILAGWTAGVTRHPLVARLRVMAAARPRQVRLGVAGGALALLALIGFASCSTADDPSGGGSASLPVFSAPAEPPDSPPVSSPTPVRTTDGCHGTVTAAQVSRAAGFQVTASGGDAAAAVNAYAQAVRAQGLQATVHICPFAGPGGDQVYVMAMTFPNAGQAERMYTNTRAGQSGAKPVPGVGDAATSDGAQTLLAKRGRSVVLVYLVRVAEPRGDHAGVLRALGLAALPKV
jgi:hypothetical protein